MHAHNITDVSCLQNGPLINSWEASVSENRCPQMEAIKMAQRIFQERELVANQLCHPKERGYSEGSSVVSPEGACFLFWEFWFCGKHKSLFLALVFRGAHGPASLPSQSWGTGPASLSWVSEAFVIFMGPWVLLLNINFLQFSKYILVITYFWLIFDGRLGCQECP